jgi:uncharacterized protein (DUF433 family)
LEESAAAVDSHRARAYLRIRVMSDKELLDRIVIDPAVMVGKPVIRGTRLTVEFILGLLAHGQTIDQITAEYEGISDEDVRACLLYAAKALTGTDIVVLGAEPG